MCVKKLSLFFILNFYSFYILTKVLSFFLSPPIPPSLLREGCHLFFKVNLQGWVQYYSLSLILAFEFTLIHFDIKAFAE